MSIKVQIWRKLPVVFKKLYLDSKAFLLDFWDKNNSEKIFTEIYKRNLWGKVENEYCSGIGSLNELIVSGYVNFIGEEADKRGFRGKVFVDLGCGDFRVGKQLVALCSKYIAVDVVKPLIEYNIKKHSSENVEFRHLDIVEDTLPAGEVCFIKQVLQHLSNRQIHKILAKLDQYTWVYITEHMPATNDGVHPNLNKVVDGKIRLLKNSGVYLSEPPFSIPSQKLGKVFEVPASGREGDYSEGVIQTYLYVPNC